MQKNKDPAQFRSFCYEVFFSMLTSMIKYIYKLHHFLQKYIVFHDLSYSAFNLATSSFRIEIWNGWKLLGPLKNWPKLLCHFTLLASCWPILESQLPIRLQIFNNIELELDFSYLSSQDWKDQKDETQSSLSKFDIFRERNVIIQIKYMNFKRLRLKIKLVVKNIAW